MKSVWAAIAVMALSLGAMSAAEARTRVGILRCYVEGGPSYVIGSAHDARCIFTGFGHRERYRGRVSRIGLDVGYTGKSEIVWAVYAPSTVYRGRALRGSYVGASGDIAVGLGGGASLLVGGNDRTFSLQPLSVKAETGVDLGLGVGDLELR